MERLPALSPDQRFDLAGCYALLAGVAAEPGSGMTSAESRALADKAMDLLRQTVAAGMNKAHVGINSDLDALRARPDFQALIKEVEKKSP
jgi:hypothetical protein